MPAPQNAAPPGAPRAHEALKQIDRLIGAARCREDSQCRVAGIGARACGGPETYRAWSTMHTDARALDTWLQVYAQERQRWHEKVGLMSTCEVVPAPGARCARERGAVGRCVLDPTAAGQR